MRTRLIMKSNNKTINTRGTIAGAIKVGIISQPLRAAETPGSGESTANINAAAMSNKRNAPKIFRYLNNYYLPINYMTESEVFISYW